MSFWKRWFRRSGESAESPETEQTLALSESRNIEVHPADEIAAERPLERLRRWLSTSGEVHLEEEDVLRVLDSLRHGPQEAAAMELARQLVRKRPSWERITLWVVECMASRGDDRGALILLEDSAASKDASLDVLMLIAELYERLGDVDHAVSSYERIVARDFDYPRARSRLARLRSATKAAPVQSSATVMAEGALTRGRYRVLQELGRGGAGTVFLAEDLELRRQVALKVYHRRGRAERARLLNEARMPLRLQHPNIVRILDLDEDLAAIAMEHVPARSIRQRIRAADYDERCALRWVEATLAALVAVHELGMVHRDVKPSNILLRDAECAVLTDFGLAALSGETDPASAAEGTLRYMAPEHRAGEPANSSMDIYAFGVSLEEIAGSLSAPSVPWATWVSDCCNNVVERRPTALALLLRVRAVLAERAAAR